MSTYVIGDVQGCFSALTHLLDAIAFERGRDTLWFTGDLVNRGPDSLSTLRFIKSLGDAALTVLGNHDLALLGFAKGFIPYKKKDNIEALLQAKDRDNLLDWLKQWPLLYVDSHKKAALVHAGIPPQWTLAEARDRAQEVETILKSDDLDPFLIQMFGNTPDTWHDDLTGMDRLRYIVNAFTRMRFCNDAGTLELATKGDGKAAPTDFNPWFKIANRKTAHVPIYFGHWAALDGRTKTENAIGLDTGCVWGGHLTAICIETGERTLVSCADLT